MQAFLRRLHSSAAAPQGTSGTACALEQRLPATDRTAQLQALPQQSFPRSSLELVDGPRQLNLLEPCQIPSQGHAQNPYHSLIPVSTQAQAVSEHSRQLSSSVQNPQQPGTLPQLGLGAARNASTPEQRPSGTAGTLDTDITLSEAPSHASLELLCQGGLAEHRLEVVSAAPGPYQEASAGQHCTHGHEVQGWEAQPASASAATEQHMASRHKEACSSPKMPNQSCQAESNVMAATLVAGRDQSSEQEQELGARPEMLHLYTDRQPAAELDVEAADAATVAGPTSSSGAGLDLEWLRTVPPGKAKEFLMGVAGTHSRSL